MTLAWLKDLTNKTKRFLRRFLLVLFAWFLLIAVYLGQDRLYLQHGLTGEYYQNLAWQGTPVFKEIEPSLNLNAARRRILSFPQRQYSARWSGWLLISKLGGYAFELRADDDADLAIDDRMIMDTHSVQTFQPVSQKIVLTKGVHRIAVKYIQRAGNSGLAIAWTTPDGKPEELPVSALFPKEPSSLRLVIEQIVRICLPICLMALIAWSLFMIAFYRKEVFGQLFMLKRLLWRFSEKLCSHFLHFRRFCYVVLLGVLVCSIFLLIKGHFMPAHGLVVSYYDNPKWEGGPLFSEVAPSLSLQVVDRYGFPQRYYSLQWQGWLYVEQEGEYTLTAKADDGIRVWLNDVMLINYTTSSQQKETRRPLHLPKGFYAITIQYSQDKYEYSFAVDWQFPNGKREPLPMQSCFPEKPSDLSFLWKRRVLTGFTLLAWGVLACVGLVMSLQQRTLRDALVRKLVEGRFYGRLRKLLHWFNSPASRQTVVVHVLLLLLIGGVIGFHRVGERSLGERIAGTWSWDEVVHTLVAQRIVAAGDWFHLEYQGKPYYNKPPLKLWLNALTFTVIGDDEFWVRSWSVVFGLAAIVTTYYLGRMLTGSPGIGLLGACILLSSPYYIFLHNLRDGVQDSAVNLFCLLALYAFWRRTEHPRWYYFAGLCMGLGALSKSVNGLLPVGVIALYLAAARSLAELKNARLYAMLLIALLLPGLWFGAHTVLSPGFFERAIHQEIFARASATAVDKNVGIGRHIFGPWYYLGSLLQGLHPWGYLYVPALLWGVWRAFSKQKTDLFLVIWVLFLLLGFSVPGYKSHWYIYGLYPPLALLIARFAFALMKGSRKIRATYPLFAALAPVALIGLLLFSLSANVARTFDNPKIPIHRLVEYLQQIEPAPYQVVAYQLRKAEPFMERPQYYLDKLASHVVSIESPAELKKLVRSGVPVFVILHPPRKEGEPFFQEAQYRYRMLNKTGDPKLDSGDKAALELLVYNHHPSMTLLLQRVSSSVSK